MVAAVQITKREHMFLVQELPFVLVQHIIGEAAHLRALAAVGTASADRFTEVTRAGIADAERAVNKSLQRHRCMLADMLHLGITEFASQHHLGKAHVLQLLHTTQVPHIALSGSVQHVLKATHLQQNTGKAQVLNKDSIHAYLAERAGQTNSLVHFIVTKERIESSEHACTEDMRVAAKLGYVLETISRGFARTESRAADIDGIRARVNGHASHLQVFGRGQQFDVTCLTHFGDKGSSFF